MDIIQFIIFKYEFICEMKMRCDVFVVGFRVEMEKTLGKFDREIQHVNAVARKDIAHLYIWQ